MKIQYISEGDIFSVPRVKGYAHGCNCAGAMGKGIAVQFKYRYPEMYILYKEKCKRGEFNVGDCFVYQTGNTTIFNLGTQETWRTKASIENIRQSLVNMMQEAEHLHVDSVAMPAIGAGLGGLDWEKVKNVIESVASDFPSITLYVVEKYKKVQ